MSREGVGPRGHYLKRMIVMSMKVWGFLFYYNIHHIIIVTISACFIIVIFFVTARYRKSQGHERSICKRTATRDSNFKATHRFDAIVIHFFRNIIIMSITMIFTVVNRYTDGYCADKKTSNRKPCAIATARNV